MKRIILGLLILVVIFETHGKFDVVQINVPGVNRFAIWRSRAFLYVPTVPSSILEITWQPSTHIKSSRIRRFPVSTGISKHCNGLKSIVELKSDVFGRLWILDAGTKKCPPKLLCFDLLFYRLSESMKYVFKLGMKLTDFVIDPGSTRSLSNVYLTGDNKLYVYSIYQDKYWPVITHMKGKITGLTLNKGAGNHQRNTLIVETDNVNIYQIFTSDMIAEKRVYAEYLGQLLGPNFAGLISDFRGNVYYLLARDFAALSWDSSLPLEAESHRVLLQSSELLFNVTDLTLDSSKNVWALVNNGTNQSSWCIKLSD